LAIKTLEAKDSKQKLNNR
jgi:chromosome segregation ATPase